MSNIAFACLSLKLYEETKDSFAVSGLEDPLMILMILSIFSRAILSPSRI